MNKLSQVWPGARRVAEWRGTDGRGLPVWQWAALWALLSIWARGFAAVEPLAQLLSPFLGLALLLPVLQQAARVARGERWQRGWWLLEPVLVMSLLALLTWDVWGYVYHHQVYNDRLDHQIMIARADEFTRRILGGEYPRYSHYAEGGDSFVDLYPSFLNLVVLLFRLVLWRAPFEMAYTAMTVFAWWLRGVAAYHLSRRFAGPVVSLVVAVGSLFEVGVGVWDGVWSGALFFGMIHNNLALTVGLYVTAFQVDLGRRFTRTRVVGVAVSSLVACLSHPLGALYVMISAVGQLFALAWGRLQRRRALRTGAVLVASLLLCAVVIIPFSHAIGHYGFFQSVEGQSYSTLGSGLFDGKHPESSLGGFIGLSLVAIVAGILSSRAAVVGPSVVALVFWTLTLSSFLAQTRFYAYVPSFLDGQQRRMLTVFKTALLPSVAWALAQLFRHLRRPASLRPGRVLLRAGVLALLLLPLGRAVGMGVLGLRDQLRGTIPDRPSAVALKRSDSSPDAEKAIEWLTAARARDTSPIPWRLALHYAVGDYSHARFWGASYQMKIPVVDYIWISAVFLGNRPRELTEQGYKDWNVKYALRIGEGKASAPDARLTLRATFGAYKIYEYRDYDDRWVTAPPEVRISNLSWQGDDIHFDVSGAPPEGADLQLRVGFLPRWQGHQDGKRLATGPAPPHGGALPRQDQVYFHARNGRVDLDARGWMPRTIPANILGLLGLIGVAIALHTPLRRRLEERFWALFDAVRARAQALVASLDPSGESFSFRRSVAVIGLISVASLIASRRGHRALILPPIEGDGMEVSWWDGMRERRCRPQPHLGRYLCVDNGKQQAELDGWLGFDPAHDQTAEYNRQWSGIRLVAQTAGRYSLVFHEMRFPSRTLRLKVSAYGQWTISGLVDGVPIARPVKASTHEEVVLELPENAPQASRLRLYVESETPNATLVLSGAVDE